MCVFKFHCFDDGCGVSKSDFLFPHLAVSGSLSVSRILRHLILSRFGSY